MWRSALKTSRPRDDRGAVAIIVTLFLLIFIVLTAFVVDFGRVYAMRAQLQNAADAAALAGAALLPVEAAAEAEAGAYVTLNPPGALATGTGQPRNPYAGYNGDPCKIYVATTEYVPFVFGPIVGVPGRQVAASAVGMLNCDFTYGIYAFDNITYSGGNSCGGYLFAGTQLVYTGPQPDGITQFPCGEYYPFKRVDVTSADNPPYPNNNNPIDPRAGLPVDRRVYNKPIETVCEYADRVLGINCDDLNDVISTTPSPPSWPTTYNQPSCGDVVQGPGGNATKYKLTQNLAANLYCTGSLNVTLPTGFTGSLGASGNSGSAGHLTSIDFSNTPNYNALLRADRDLVSLDLPGGYSQPLYAGRDIDSVDLSGTSVTNESITAIRDIRNLSLPNNYSGMVWAGGDAQNISLGTGFTGTLVVGGSISALTLPNGFNGRILVGGSIGTISGDDGSFNAAASPQCVSSSRPIYSRSGGITGDDLVTNETIIAPGGMVDIKDNNGGIATVLCSSINGNEVKFEGGRQAASALGGVFPGVGIRLAE